MTDLKFWGAIVVSALSQMAFFAALLVAYLTKDGNNLSLLIGCVIANSTTAVSFWLGSSSQSHVATPTPTPPVTQGTTTP